MRDQPHPARFLRVDPDNPDRWWTRFVFWHVLIVLVWIGLGMFFTHDIGHRYTSNPPPPPKPGEKQQHPLSSLGWVHQHFTPWLPWWVVGVVFLLIAVLICFKQTRPAAYFAGALIGAVYILVTIEYTYLSGNSTNPITVPLSTLAPDALLAGFRYAILPPRVAHPRREAS